MASDTFAARLQKAIDPLQERLMYHPLNQAIFNGTLPVPVLREYAKQAYLWKRYAQDLLPVLIPKAPDDVRRLLIKNLVSEEGLGGEPPHLQLLIEFGEEARQTRFKPCIKKGLGQPGFQRFPRDGRSADGCNDVRPRGEA